MTVLLINNSWATRIKDRHSQIDSECENGGKKMGEQRETKNSEVQGSIDAGIQSRSHSQAKFSAIGNKLIAKFPLKDQRLADVFPA